MHAGENVPIMLAVLPMNAAMSEEWLLVTLAAGIGGSLLSVGSAAGVAHGPVSWGLNFSCPRSWAITLSYIVSIAAHPLSNRHLF